MISLTRDDAAPFIIYALPRSRTKWLSSFLSYGDYECAHEQMRFLRGMDDARSWLSQDFTGVADTSAAQWWRVVQRLRPDIRTVVVRRPREDVLASLMALDMRGVCTFDRTLLNKQLEVQDRRLDCVERQVPDVLSVRFDDLKEEHVCAEVFEHCLPYEHDQEWWKAWAPLNIQASMPSLIRYTLKHRRQIKRTAQSALRQIRMLPTSQTKGQEKWSLRHVTTQIESFETFWRDGQHLFADHAEEVGGRDGVILNPNVPLAHRLEEAGAVQILTARARGKMVGYLVTLISPSLEDRDMLNAFQNTFFVSKPYRGIGPRLQRESIERLRTRGVDEVILRAGVRGSGPKLGALYQRLGAQEYGRLYNLMLKAA